MGGRGFQCGKGLLVGCELRRQSFQLGTLLRGLCPGQLGGVSGLFLLTAQGVQRVVGAQSRLCLRDLPGQRIQLGSVACVAGAFGPGGFQCGQGCGKGRLLFRQLRGQLRGLPGGAQLLLQAVQLGFRLFQGGSGRLLRGGLPGQQGVQQSQRGFRFGLGAECGKGCGVRVIGGKSDAGKQAVQLCVLRGALLVQAGGFLLQAVLQPGVALGAEQLAEDADALLGGSVEQLCELPLRDHGDLRKLAVVQPDDLLHGGGHVFCFGHRWAAVGVGEGGVGLLGGKALAAHFGAGVLRVAAHGIALAVHLKFQFYKGGRSRVGVLAAQHGPLAHAAAGMVVQSVCNGVKQGGLARAGVAGDEVQSAHAQFFQFQHGLACIGAKGRESEL